MLGPRSIPPYRQLRSESVACEPKAGWEVEVRGAITEVLDGESFPDWDASLAFALKRRFRIGESALLDLGVSDPRDIRLKLVVRMSTAGGLSSSVPAIVDFPPSSDAVEVRIVPSLGALTRDLVLESSVVVVGVDGLADALVPSFQGARVWGNKWRMQLEAEKSKLPFEILDFQDSYSILGLADALFHVEVADDPELDFEQGVCVSINSRFEAFVSAVERLEPVTTAMLWDSVLRRILMAGIGSRFSLGEKYPESSVGAQWARWMGQVFPGETVESANRMLVDQPSRFEARIQAWSQTALRLNAGLSL